MKLPTLTQIAKGEANLIKYQDGNLWYDLAWTGDDSMKHTFMFPIHWSDAGEGDFFPVMRGITIVRWARKHVELLSLEQGPG